MDNYKREYNLIPRAAVESRWKEKLYVPEIQVNGQQYVLGPPESTHEAANAIAEAKVNELFAAIKAVTHGLVGHLPKAKA